MATINRMQGSGNQNFKQIEGDSWLSMYLPAICAGTLMALMLFLAVSCSKKSDKQVAKMSPPTEPAVTNPASPVPVAEVPAKPKKLKKHHRPVNATYVNSTYGVSFSYPWKYSLEPGDRQAVSPIETSFLKPGAVQIASVDMPDSSYPETDFSGALVNVSVNQGMTGGECAQFASDSNDGSTMEPESVKLGANEFSAFEQVTGVGDHKSDLKYFHLFKNNACYEFALDLETSAQPESDVVDHGKVFQKLEKILTTARIKDVQLPGMENAEKAALKDATPDASKPTDAAAPASTTSIQQTSDKAEKAQIETPSQK